MRRATARAVVLRPKDVRAQLAVSASTLRQWSELFKDYLSPAAQTSTEAGRAHRRYTPGDVQVLARVGQLIHVGHRYQEVRQLLPSSRSHEPAEQQARTQDAERDRRIRLLEGALAQARVRIDALEEQCTRCERLLAVERGAKAEARRKLTEALRVNERLTQANIGLHAQVAYLERERDGPVWKRIFQ